MLFEIGSTIKIKEGLVEGRYGEVGNQVYFNQDMVKYCGMTAVVVGIQNNKYELDIDDGDWSWNDSLVEKYN